MNAILKSVWIDSAEIDLDLYAPDDPEDFGFWINFKVGLVISDGADDFRIFVCTPDWIKNENRNSIWGRHFLIIKKYDINSIKNHISNLLLDLNGDDWSEISAELSKFAAWEFDGC